MYVSARYESPLGPLFSAGDGAHLVGVWFENAKYFCEPLKKTIIKQEEDEVLCQTKKWLDRYFAGEMPLIQELALAPEGSAFRQEVWRILCEIPYGNVTTYGEIAAIVAQRLGRKRMSAQAVGGAVGHNPISIIIPCHRVIGADGTLTGYAGGVERKGWLLRHEKANSHHARSKEARTTQKNPFSTPYGRFDVLGADI